MYTRHDEFPAISAWPTKVDARTYNAVCRALSRSGRFLRFDLPNFYRLEMILQPCSWVVVDTNSNDLPITAWAGFDDPGNRALHDPVRCELRYYHGVSAKVASHLREGLGALLEARLAGPALDAGPRVVGFPRGGLG